MTEGRTSGREPARKTLRARQAFASFPLHCQRTLELGAESPFAGPFKCTGTALQANATSAATLFERKMENAKPERFRGTTSGVGENDGLGLAVVCIPVGLPITFDCASAIAECHKLVQPNLDRVPLRWIVFRFTMSCELENCILRSS